MSKLASRGTWHLMDAFDGSRAMFMSALWSKRSGESSAITFVIGRSAYELYLLPDWEVESVSSERVIVVTKKRYGQDLDCFTFRPRAKAQIDGVTSYWLMPPPFSLVIQKRIGNKNAWRVRIIYLVCLLFKKQIRK